MTFGFPHVGGPSVKLFVDGHSLGWRVFHAIQGLVSQGFPTGMAYGFLSVLRNILEEVRATHCLIAWDDGVPAFRRVLLPTYKLKGPPTPQETLERSDFYQQREWLQEVLPFLGVSWVLGKSWEADDIIGSWVRYLGPNDYAIILSGDRDMWQLVTRKVSCRILGRKPLHLRLKGILLTPENFQEVTGLPDPAAWFAYRVVSGDGSDGVPGVPTIGEKRGREIAAGGWPRRGDGGKYAQLLQKHTDIIQRNVQLMFLADRAKEIAVTGVLSGKASAADFALAKLLVDRLEMQEFTSKWEHWTGPFRRLR